MKVETRHEGVDWIQSAQTGVQWWGPVNMVTDTWGYIEGRECLEKLSDYQLLMNQIFSLMITQIPPHTSKNVCWGQLHIRWGVQEANFEFRTIVTSGQMWAVSPSTISMKHKKNTKLILSLLNVSHKDLT